MQNIVLKKMNVLIAFLKYMPTISAFEGGAVIFDNVGDLAMSIFGEGTW